MAKRLQLRGGTTSQHSSFTGAVREVTVDTDKDTLVVHDGSTAGGHPLATATNFKSTGIDDNADATALTIDSGENVGIGTTSMSAKLHIVRTDVGALNDGNSNGIMIEDTNCGICIGSATTGEGHIYFSDSNDADVAAVSYFHTNNFMQIRANASERARIDASGNLFVATTTEASDDVGHALLASGAAYHTADGTYAGLFNRKSSDGDLVQFRKDNTVKHVITTTSLGLNQSSPSATLDVVGNAEINGNINNNGKTFIRKDGASESEHLVITNETGGSNASPTFTDIQFNGVQGKDRARIRVQDQSDNKTGGFMRLETSGGNTTDGSSFETRIFLDNDGDIFFYEDTGTTAKVKWDATNERFGIGETVPLGTLHVKSGDSGVSSPDVTDLVVECSGNGGISLLGGSAGQVEIAFGDNSDPNIGRFAYNNAANYMATVVNGTEATRIAANNDFYVGTTSGSVGTVGFKVFGIGGTHGSGVNIVAKGGNVPCTLNRLTGDGNLMGFRSQTTEEGSISVSGTTVSYNGFTGTHWSRFTDNSTPTILRGTVLETLDEMCDWYNLEFDVTDENENTYTEKVPHVLLDSQSNGDTVTYNHEGTDVQATIVKEDDIKHMMSKVSDTTDAKNVYGVFNSWEQGDEGYNDFLVASVGSYVVRIKSGQTIAKGDLLQSNGDGTAKVQIDDNIKSSSFAKVLSTTIIETYEDGSYLVPCSLNC